MTNGRYKLYIDGRLAYDSDRVAVLKSKAEFEFEYLNAFYAKIMTGTRIYADKRYDGRWHNWGTAKIKTEG